MTYDVLNSQHDSTQIFYLCKILLWTDHNPQGQICRQIDTEMHKEHEVNPRECEACCWYLELGHDVINSELIWHGMVWARPPASSRQRETGSGREKEANFHKSAEIGQ